VAEGEGHAPSLRQIRWIFAFEDEHREAWLKQYPLLESCVKAFSTRSLYA
jgi:hypothetical protein